MDSTPNEVRLPEDVVTAVVETEQQASKKNMLPWKIVCLLLALIVSLGWIGIIALLIMKEEWQLVLVAWLILYAAVHFCYWYCRRHSSRAISTQIRHRVIARLRGTDVSEICDGDCPPSYDDLVKSEVPPPAYYSVVDESPRLQRLFKGHSLGLPWFLKKKSLAQHSPKPSSSSSEGVTVVVVESSDAPLAVGGSASTSASSTAAEQSERTPHPAGVWKSSGSASTVVVVIDDGDEESTIELPTYEALMKENVQPVLTPIHQALAGLPTTLPPPPPYSPKPMDTISEDLQEQNE